MAVIETSGRFDTDAVRRLLDEYERGYRQHDQHLAAIAAQSVLLIEDAARLYEETDRLRLDEAHCIMLRAAKDKLEAENEKLRKLCGGMFTDFVNCDYELMRHGKTFMAVTRYFDRLCELGIEVKP